MSREEIIRMAQQSGMNIGRTNIGGSIEDLVRFAEAVRSAAAIAQPVQPADEFASRLYAVLEIVRLYLPPDGISANEAIGKIITLVDPWPVQTSSDPSKVICPACVHEFRAVPCDVQGDAADAQRYREMKPRMLGVDFDWNETGKSVLVFEWPYGLPVGANCDKNIDAAIAAKDAK